MSNVIDLVNSIATEVTTEIATEFSDVVIATGPSLHITWLYFRTNNAESLAKFGPPVNNMGVPHEPLSSRLIDPVIYPQLEQWFIKYIRMTAPVNILRIETPVGGIFIRSGNTKHAFVTADLPRDSTMNVTMATFETVQ